MMALVPGSTPFISSTTVARHGHVPVPQVAIVKGEVVPSRIVGCARPAVNMLCAATPVAALAGVLRRRRHRKTQGLSVLCRAQPLGLASFHGGAYLTAEAKAELERVCVAIATPGKGITACDEGPGTVGGRFENVGVENSEETRRRYRQMLFEAEGIGEYLSAAILDPETIFQKDDDGVLFPKALMDRDILPGVKPHLKVYELPGTGGETVMQGLDSLADRLRDYKDGGAVFAKWRSPLQITSTAPSDFVIEANMRDLARYALICQAEGLVPIVEPDVVMKGDHTLEDAVAVNAKVHSSLYRAMLDHGVWLEGSILKTNMVNPGLSCPTSYTVAEIAEANVQVMRRVVPAACRSINFLSGGQTLEDAAARLNAINQAKGNSPWNLSFSWSAALQMPLLDLCRGEGGELPLDAMSKLYLEELQVASAAALGEHSPKAGDGDHTSP